MKKTIVLIVLFAVFTVVVMNIDVRPIGPMQSEIGLAGINAAVFDFIGVHLLWYHITDWLGIGAILIAMGFAVLGLAQWIKRRSLLSVDKDILALGLFYILVTAIYLLFEMFIVNYRPILMDGVLEASYPSSHTMIVLSFMGAAIVQFRLRIKSASLRVAACGVCFAIIAVTVIGRFVSGVHWFTDIAGGVLLGLALIAAYSTVARKLHYRTVRTGEMA